MAQYELLLLGSPTDTQRRAIIGRMATAEAEFGMTPSSGIAVRGADKIHERDTHAATTVLYFGGDATVDATLLEDLLEAKAPVVPVVAEGEKVGSVIPASLQAINACFVSRHDTTLDGVCAVALESLGLLHEQRRVFVSYRRVDSREAAVQLHDELSAKGFDVFLDTHSIRPGHLFQEMLWHRLADCDIVIMLDTKGYLDSQWTKQELGRALAHGIRVLRLVWPAHTPTRFLSLSDTVPLQPSDFDPGDRLKQSKVDEIIAKAETLRSASVAARHRTLVGKLVAEVQSIQGTFGGAGAYHATTVDLQNGLKLEVYPAVGVPTALLLNEIHRKTRDGKNQRNPCLIYDDIGLSPAWLSHLDWLNENIKEVKAVKVSKAAWEFAAWDV